MSIWSPELAKYGFKKEGQRGTGEAAPAKLFAPGADIKLDYASMLITDKRIRGIAEDWPSKPGVKEGTGTLPDVDIDADTIGDFLKGCLGSCVTTQPDPQGAPNVYQHVFKPTPVVQFPSYTIFADRGINVLKYVLGVFKKMEMKGIVDGKATVDIDTLFKSEASAAAFAGTFPAPAPFLFYQTEIEIGGVVKDNVRSWTLSMDNASFAQRVLNKSRDAKDIVSTGKFLNEGAFEIFFDTEEDRQKFLEVTDTSLKITMTGDVIEAAFAFKLMLELPNIHYSKYGYGTIENLFGAAVGYKPEYSAAQGFGIRATLINNIASYA